MQHLRQHYVNGLWSDPIDPIDIPLINPATEQTTATILGGGRADVDRAVVAARAAFPSFSLTAKEERIELLRRILVEYERRRVDLAAAITEEIGAPKAFALEQQVGSGIAHLVETIKALEAYDFEHRSGSTVIAREAIGVVGLITPWNWPLNQVVCKVAPALAAGCTMLLKPSEISPLSAIIFSEVMHAARVPAGVYNMVQGDGARVGAAMSAHPNIDMISFTGSTRAGILIAQSAAVTVKRVAQELGGKSANILLSDADFPTAVAKGVLASMVNAGQSCSIPTRMLVPRERHGEVKAIAKTVAESIQVGAPYEDGTQMGPLVSAAQFEKVQALIRSGIEEGAELVSGGSDRPEPLAQGYFVRPTIFAGVTERMKIAREEIFGPVLSILPYEDDDDAIRIANSTSYGLAAYIQTSDPARARHVARKMRAGIVQINYPVRDMGAPFGGYKQSGNGREYGKWGIEEYLETKSIMGEF
ncbi:MAG: aldehyde dehydrogenase family protein [Xanthobacteraceae bacterium]